MLVKPAFICGSSCSCWCCGFDCSPSDQQYARNHTDRSPELLFMNTLDVCSSLFVRCTDFHKRRATVHRSPRHGHFAAQRRHAQIRGWILLDVRRMTLFLDGLAGTTGKKQLHWCSGLAGDALFTPELLLLRGIWCLSSGARCHVLHGDCVHGLQAQVSGQHALMVEGFRV